MKMYIMKMSHANIPYSDVMHAKELSISWKNIFINIHKGANNMSNKNKALSAGIGYTIGNILIKRN